MAGNLVVETKNLSKIYDDTTAVDNLNLKIKQGDLFGFLGPNGAGKTTTILMMLGLTEPTSGSVYVGGYNSTREPLKVKSVSGYVPEKVGFYEGLTASYNLSYIAKLNNLPDDVVDKRVKETLQIVGLAEKAEQPVGEFSKGMKQRLALARALLHEPRVLFLDEPTAGLDPEAAREVREMIQALSQEGRTAFLSTHNLAEAEMLCRRIAVIRTELLALDKPENLRQRLFRRRVAVRLEAVETPMVEALGKLPFVEKLTRDGNQLLVELTDPERNRPDLVKSIVDAGGRVMAVSEEGHSLEEVYLTLIGEEADDGT